MAHDIVSLITVLDGILEEDRILDDKEKALLESLFEKVTCLKNVLEKSVTQHHKRGNKEIIRELQSEIRDAAHEAEDIIESHAVDQKLSESEVGSFAIDIHSMSKVMEKFDAANDKLTSIIKLQSHDEGETTIDVISNPSLSVAADPKANTALMMVGFDEDALHLKGRLTSATRKREIIPIVGMGGIGKTTLARNLYHDPLIVSHFDARAWVTVSQDYSVRAILLGLLGSIFGNISEHMLQLNVNDLGDDVYRRLYGKRYLVVLDDIWSEKAWDEIQRYFPKEDRGSRIMITSRELDVAKHPDPTCKEHQLHLLTDAQCWELLCHKVFEKDEHCPPFLEEIGRKIASDCAGLPLAISVIGGLLSVEKHSKALWGRVARDVRSITNNHISDILCLSYDNLPLHLKPCFLYMSAFPEDFEVRRSKLVKLLAAEGFCWMSNGKNKSLEDVAEEHLKALVDRNLLSVTKTKYNGRAESYTMHDLLRDLCVTKAYEEKFLHIIVKYDNFNYFRRVGIHYQFAEDAPALEEDLSCCRSLLCIRRPTRRLVNTSPILSTLRLVRVLDLSGIFLFVFPEEILKLANLRFLAIYIFGCPPFELWRFRNLQTLLIHNHNPLSHKILPYEAWEISSLRGIVLKYYQSIDIDFEVPRVQENLQTISGIRLHGLLASNLINNIPNIKRLGIDACGFDSEDEIIDLSHLHKLETLKLHNFSVAALSLLKLPNRIKKLSFYRCTLPMGLVNGVGDLQYLEVLKIKDCIFQSEEHNEGEEEWELYEGVEFCSLQFLELYDLSIVHWKADYSHFPRLRHLRIRDCEDLKEIPACIGETLEMIELYNYNPHQVCWANEVREIQQYEYGNENLQIRALIEDIYMP